MELFFCIDGGGTRSRAALMDRDGRKLASALSGPCNPSTNRARALASLVELWSTCCQAIGRDPAQTADAVLSIGAAGLYVPATRDAFLADCPRFAHAVTLSDGYAALIGAGRGQPSAFLIAGTGVAGHRLYADGRSVQRDAWGWVAGDRGSGAWIGRAGVRHCFAALDGVVPRDALASVIFDAIGGFPALQAGWLKDLTPDRLGAFVPLVLEQADLDVSSAVAIRERAVAHLARLCGVLDSDTVPLYAAGGVADVLRPRLTEAVGRAVAQPEADALFGCWLVAADRAPPERADVFGTEQNS
jgi:glucosamine kinase